MKRFFTLIILFGLFLLIIAVGIFCLADGTSDSHYLNLTTPKQKSLIIGTSKAAQGMQPAIFNKILKRGDINNFSFTVAHSPYGPVYLNAIKKKLDRNGKNGIFIITVDPYSLSSRDKDPNNIELFRENDKFLATINNFDSNPNFDYLINEYAYPYIYILTKKFNFIDDDLLHKDGWVEINISMDPKAFEIRKAAKLKDYERLLDLYQFSETRLKYLEKTIVFLKEYGDVYLVRLPVSAPFLVLENRVYSEFDHRIENISKKLKAPFLDLTKLKDKYQYTDGNHLYKTSGAKVSQRIAEWIKLEN